MDMKLEVVLIPVTDIDRAKAFYEQVGFVCDTDHDGGEHFRVIQMTPPGSACSVVFGKGMPSPATPAVGLHLVVADLPTTIDDLRGTGVEITGPFHFGATGQVDGLHPDRADYGSFAAFEDPDGNGFLLQETPSRA